MGRYAPIGSAFISYAKEDETFVQNVIISNFESAGVQYLIDKRDIVAGRTVSEVSKLIDAATCGVIVLSDASESSPWVHYETGLLEGKGKAIIPFLAQQRDREEFLNKQPEFLRQYTALERVEDLINAVQAETFLYGQLLSNEAFDNSLAKDIREVQIHLVLSIPRALRPYIRFGYLLVRFGQHHAFSQLPDGFQEDQGRLVNIPIDAVRRDEDPASEQLKVSLHVPIHNLVGVQFKPFVDVLDMQMQDAVAAVLKEEGLEEVTLSASAESQRIYFLLPADRPLSHMETPEGFTNNYLYPQ